MSLSLLSAYTDYWKDEAGKHYDYPDIWTSFAKDSLSWVFLWCALALVAVLLAVGLFVRFKRADKLSSYVKTAVTITVGFAGSVIVTMLALEFLDMQESGAIFPIVLVPAIVLAVSIVLGIAAMYVGTLFSQKTKKITAIVSVSCICAAVVAMLVCLIIYFTSGDAASNNGVSDESVNNLALYLTTAGLIAAIALAAFFFGKGEKKDFDSKSISYAAVCIAMSFALSYLRLWEMPQGGSITPASLLPLMVYSYMFGVRKGVFAGLIYGILQAVQDPWIIHPAQFLLDYPVAFAAIGLSGMFARMKKLERLPQVQFALGAVVASVLRFAAHVFSGVFAFSEYATLDNVWAYSSLYNSFVFVDIAIVIVVGVLVFSSPSIVKQARRFHPKTEKPATEPEPAEPAE
ncbi:MAG: energy-coupled thiamine transporter ThiT [Clostridia bacterium]|nr:energy-coupled thiamine transporter ThiT [Clostridia bacterium]